MTATTELALAASDVGEFSERVLGFRLFDHQLKFLRSSATYRVICSGRQSGKSRAVAAACLYEAATRANIRVLIVSQGEEASLALLQECATLMDGSPLSGSRLDETKTQLTLSNGSTIKCVPASTRQIRGKSIDLLCMDEAAFLDEAIWQAAEPTMAARPGARAILSSTPWGDMTHFYRKMFNRGMMAPDAWVESFQWPSSVSPLVSEKMVEFWRTEWPDYKFRTEILAEWADSAGAYFSEAEIMDAVADYAMCPPEKLEYWLDRNYATAGGIDWAFSADGNALSLVSVLEDHGMNREILGNNLAFFVPWLEVKYKWPYNQFIDRIIETAGKYYIRVLASETNGVGQFPTSELQRRAGEAQRDCYVSAVVTDVRRKQSGFSMIKGLLQQNRLVLPRDPELLKQLRGLEFEQLPSGNLRIAVPDRAGHDDLAMSFMQAVSCLMLEGAVRYGDAASFRGDPSEDLVTTKSGLVVPRMARPVAFHQSFLRRPRGLEAGENW